MAANSNLRNDTTETKEAFAAIETRLEDAMRVYALLPCTELLWLSKASKWPEIVPNHYDDYNTQREQAKLVAITSKPKPNSEQISKAHEAVEWMFKSAEAMAKSRRCKAKAPDIRKIIQLRAMGYSFNEVSHLMMFGTGKKFCYKTCNNIYSQALSEILKIL